MAFDIADRVDRIIVRGERGGAQVPAAKVHGWHDDPAARFDGLIKLRPLREDQPLADFLARHGGEVDEIDYELAEITESAVGHGVYSGVIVRVEDDGHVLVKAATLPGEEIIADVGNSRRNPIAEPQWQRTG